MRTLLVVDASVVAKWLVPEPDSLSAVSLRASHDFAGPDLLFAEIVSILWKRQRRGELDAEEADAAFHALSRAQFRIEAAQTMTREAYVLARQLDHSAYDCFYLIAAARLGTVLVTADDKLLRKLHSAPPEWSRLAVGLREFTAG